MPKKFFLATFGCRTNQADSAALRQHFIDQRFQEAHQPSEADVIVVNSCTVTHRSDQQVRQLTRKLRRQNAAAKLIVTGCYAQRSPRTLARIPGVDAVVGNTHKEQLVQLAVCGDADGVSALSEEEMAAIYRDDFGPRAALEAAPAARTGGRTRPFVKIQDGCDAGCSYCIIPQVRGPGRSLPPDGVLQQVRDLVAEGFKEVVLTGIHIGSYGMRRYPRYPLDRLLEDLVAVPGLRRLRLSSIEPMQLSRRIIDLAAGCAIIAPHFHICLQSGSDRILRKMRRPYTVKRFASIVEAIRAQLPRAAIGTDVIVGFPGETGEDHRETMAFIRAMPFTYLHVFPYSDRPGTLASRMRCKVSSALVGRRSAELRQLSDEKNRTFRRSFLGSQLSVLTLSEVQQGTRSAISENYLRVRLNSSVPENELVTGTAVEEEGDGYLRLQVIFPAPPPRWHVPESG